MLPVAPFRLRSKHGPALRYRAPLHRGACSGDRAGCLSVVECLRGGAGAGRMAAEYESRAVRGVRDEQRQCADARRHADVYRPATSQPVPVILHRTQYNKTEAQVQPSRYQSPDWFASHCYLVVTQDIRGLYASDGTFSEFTNDQNDGYDSVEWAARLPGSNGKVGMYGSYYVGATQWLAAEAATPHLATLSPAKT